MRSLSLYLRLFARGPAQRATMVALMILKGAVFNFGSGILAHPIPRTPASEIETGMFAIKIKVINKVDVPST